MLRDEGELHVDSFAKYAAAFLRNGHRRRWLEDEAEGLGAPMQVGDNPRAIAGLVGGRPRVDVVHPVTEGIVEENRDLACGRGDRLDLADARGEPPVEGAPGLRKPITAGWLLRARRERPRHCRAEKGDEVPASHSITSPIMRSSVFQPSGGRTTQNSTPLFTPSCLGAQT